LYPSQNIIKVMKPRGMRWARYIGRVGEMRNSYYISVEKSEIKKNVEDLEVNGKI